MQLIISFSSIPWETLEGQADHKLDLKETSTRQTTPGRLAVKQTSPFLIHKQLLPHSYGVLKCTRIELFREVWQLEWEPNMWARGNPCGHADALCKNTFKQMLEVSWKSQIVSEHFECLPNIRSNPKRIGYVKHRTDLGAASIF